jgi:secondary thiamine-phosphate synthase enzyme
MSEKIEMNWYKDTIEIPTHGKGLYPFTQAVAERLKAWRVKEGMCFLYLPHASASLLISEDYDPSARADLETFMEKLAPDGQAWHQHDLEGADDSTSHIRAMLTHTDLTIPVEDGQLCLGTWQGICLFEHRARNHRRRVLIRVLDITN